MQWQGYSIRKHPFIIILERIISKFNRRNGSPHDGILDSPVDRPWQFQSGRLGSSLFIRSAGHQDQSNTTVSVQLGSILGPPGCIEVGKNRRCTNHTNTGKIAPGLDNGTFTGIRDELLLRDLDLFFGGIVTDP